VHPQSLTFPPSGADVSAITASPDAAPSGADSHAHHLQSFAALNLSLTRSFYTHPKILVVGLNGPAVGLSAALSALADVVYCSPTAFLLTPFSSLGLVAEGASSRALARRLGPARAADALLMSRRVGAADLERCGFVSKILAPRAGQDWETVLMDEVDDRLGPHLNAASLLEIKRLMRLDETPALERHNAAEVFAGMERFMAGVPQGEFAKVARGEKRHKL
jgi:peroxisomal 3,2-trans-enoyl-CoA isomerase